ncbi:TPR-domain containing protein [Chitinispirillum alkaliphilum]|nr:TPR-domain containing protein [Chitinispirillum alkaliphilum]
MGSEKIIAGSFRPRLVLLLAILLLTYNSSFADEGSGGYDSPYFQADFIQDLSDWSSALVNPALLYRVNQMRVDFGMYRWAVGPDLLGYQHFGFLMPIRRNHTAGITVLTASGLIQEADFTPDGSAQFGSTKPYQDTWLIGNYGVRVMPWLMLGANLKFRTQNQFGNSVWGTIPGLDLGVYLNPFDHYRYGDLGFSISMQDLVPSQISWEDVGSDQISVTRARVGVRYAALNKNLVTSFEVLVDNALAGVYSNLGWDDWKDMFMDIDSPEDFSEIFPVIPRYGFHVKWQFVPSIWLKGGWNNNNIPYLGFNYNTIYLFPEMINYLNFDYQLGYSFIERSGSLADQRGFTMMGRVSTDFGPTREQRESRRLYRQLVVAPMDVYLEAMRHYYAGRYWEASFAFGKLMTIYPNFHLNDKAVNYMGNSYVHLHLNQLARNVFQEAMQEYSASDMRAHYVYGLAKIDYREEKYDEVLRRHAYMVSTFPESDVRSSMDYLAGEVHFLRNDLQMAERTFSAIKETDSTYLYAQYTMSSVNFLRANSDRAIQNLQNIINDTTSVAAIILLQDRANLKLGHLYFEEGELRQAVEAYSRIAERSKYGDEALLGTAWAYIRANQPEVAMEAADRILRRISVSPLVPEAYLLRGYALMLLRRYPEAVVALERCVEVANRDYISSDDVRAQKNRFASVEREFEPVAAEIKRNALRRPTERTIEERAQLQREYQGFASENDKLFQMVLDAKSHSRFLNRKDDILYDAEYALARAVNRVQSSAQTDLLEQHRQKEAEIQDELERLRRELELLEE